MPRSAPSLKIETRRLFRDAGRAAGGAPVFSLPMPMTMEMWWLGFYMGRLRLALLIVLTILLLTELSHQIGFRHMRNWRDDFLDAFIACGIGAAHSMRCGKWQQPENATSRQSPGPGRRIRSSG